MDNHASHFKRLLSYSISLRFCWLSSMSCYRSEMNGLIYSSRVHSSLQLNCSTFKERIGCLPAPDIIILMTVSSPLCTTLIPGNLPVVEGCVRDCRGHLGNWEFPLVAAVHNALRLTQNSVQLSNLPNYILTSQWPEVTLVLSYIPLTVPQLSGLDCVTVCTTWASN